MGDDSGPQVLIVDDDKSVRQMMATFLEDGGYRVMEADDGVEALRMLRASPSRLVVLLDWMMLHISGEQVLQAVQNDGTTLSRHTYILVTANSPSRSSGLLALLDTLCVAVLPKPFRLQHLLNSVDECAARIHGDEEQS